MPQYQQPIGHEHQHRVADKRLETPVKSQILTKADEIRQRHQLIHEQTKLMATPLKRSIREKASHLAERREQIRQPEFTPNQSRRKSTGRRWSPKQVMSGSPEKSDGHLLNVLPISFPETDGNKFTIRISFTFFDLDFFFLLSNL